MNQRLVFASGWTICGLLLASSAAAAPQAPEAPLTAAGQRLEARYASQLQALQAEIRQALPEIAAEQQAALQQARGGVAQATAAAAAAQQALGQVQTAKALVEHAKGKWIGGAEKGIAQAQTALKNAKTDAERKAAEAELTKWQANKQDGLKALEERQQAYDQARQTEPQLLKAKQAADAALAQAQAQETTVTGDLLKLVEPVLASDRLDAQLTRCAVLSSATPRGLAEFAQQSSERESLLEKLLGSDALLRQMLSAGGAKGGQYGRATEIYAAIRQAHPRSQEGVFQRLALATSLEHALPIGQRNAEAAKNAPAVVDPVQRYAHYEQAYLAGELDPAFPHLTVWQLRMVVNSDAPDEVLAWGRRMLRNYRPDHILNPDYGWRYSGLVRTDVAYRSLSLLQDDNELEFFQNVCKEGGICGRRAFFGRFIVKSFGLPTWGVGQHKHAALGRWTPAGWVVNLGANWNFSWSSDPLDNRRTGTDFILEAQARDQPQEYWRVLRAQWVGAALVEAPCDSTKPGSGGLWNNLALAQKRALVAAAKPATLAALGAELGEANESAAAQARALSKAPVTAADKQIVVAPTGVITIPAAACSGAQLVPSFLGGQQMVCSGTVTCRVAAPQAGKYALTARVVTLHEDVQLQVTAGGAKEPLAMPIPYTCGEWAQTEPLLVTLSAGENKLSFAQPTKNFALKDFTLTPQK